jgi:FixJ family two-component response regulator
MITTSTPPPHVFLVDDDLSILRALSRGLCALGFRVRTWDSAIAFLREQDPQAPGCLVADVAMPEVDGFKLQAMLAARGETRPIIFITGKGCISMSVEAMRSGAVTFLSKPVHLAELAAAVHEAVARDATERQRRARRSTIEDRMSRLTARDFWIYEQADLRGAWGGGEDGESASATRHGQDAGKVRGGARDDELRSGCARQLA